MKFKNLVGKRFNIKLGSSVESIIWDKDVLIQKIANIIKHNLFDSEFYYNWTDNGAEYFNVFKTITLTPMIEDLENTLNEYFVFKNVPYSKNQKALMFNSNHNDNVSWIDNWFQTNKTISDELKKDYYNYRKCYAGVLLT